MQQPHFFLSFRTAIGVFAQREIEVVAAHENRRRMGELAEPPFTMIGSHA